MDYVWFTNLRLGKAARLALKHLAYKQGVKIGQVVGQALTEWYNGDRKAPKEHLSYIRETKFQVLVAISDDLEEYGYFMSDFHKKFNLSKIEFYSNVVYDYLVRNSEDFKKRTFSITKDFSRIEDGDVKFMSTSRGKDMLVLYGRIKEKEAGRRKLMANRRKREKRNKRARTRL